MAIVRISVRADETDIEITESNTDRLEPSIRWGAPVDFDRLSDSLGSLLAQAVIRACGAMNVDVADVVNSIDYRQTSRSSGGDS